MVRFKTEILKTVFENADPDIEWDKVRHELITSERYITPSNVDSIFIGLCSKERRLDIAKSYVDYMKSQSLPINNVIVSKLLRLYYMRRPLSTDDEAVVIKWCKELMDKNQPLEATLAENMIHGLSQTEEWMKCLELFHHIQAATSINTSTYSCIIWKALDEGNLDIAWNLLNQMSSELTLPKSTVFLKYLDKYGKDDVATERLLKYIGENNLLLPDCLVEEFRDVVSKSRNCEIVEITRKGRCKSCSNKLPNAKLNEAEFDKLSNTFLKEVMIRKDIFIKTNPEEVEKFKRFIDRVMPFDVIIDGLNVAYSFGAQQPPDLFVKNVRLQFPKLVDILVLT